jgi:Rod binding domain-containing protein
MSTLPPIDNSVLPAAIRNGTPAERKNYQAALGFERMLVQQLTKSLADTTKADGDDESSSAATNTYRSMLPDVLADGITSAGGLGLAQQLVKGLR